MTDPTPQTTTRDEAVTERPRIEPLLKDGDVVDRLKQFRLRWQDSGDLTYLGKALVDAIVEIEAHRCASAPAPASGRVEAVAVKPLVWEETYYQSHDTPPELTGWEAEGACGYYHIKIEYTGFEASLDGVSFFKIGTFDDPDEAKSAAQSDFETRIRSALVSGSREDGE